MVSEHGSNPSTPKSSRSSSPVLQALLYGLDLFKYLDGSHPKPLPTVSVDGSSVPHADYPQWFRQERLIFGALVGSLSETIVPLIQSVDSSRDAWEILEKTYASPSRGHIKQLKHRLKQTTKLPTQSVSDYMRQIKTITDELAILGKKMDNEDLIDAILDGLDQSQYKPILDAIHARDTVISFNELHEKLINHELSLAQQTPVTGLHQPAAVFHVQQNHRQGSGHRSWPPKNQNVSSANYGRPLHHNQGILPTPNSNAGSNTGSKPFLGKCQWCHHRGHSLTNCQAFKKMHPTIIAPPYEHNTQPKHAQVNTMSLVSPPDQANWIFDSGASHHVTTDLNNLSFHAPYDGTEELVIGHYKKKGHP
ncbi:hypothetical protein LXL04_017031 [Taraxacum kok-saghyz]